MIKLTFGAFKQPSAEKEISDDLFTSGRLPENFPKEVLEELSDMPNYENWIVGRFKPSLGGRAAEIGAGLGSISEHLLSLVDYLELVEPSQTLIGPLIEKFGETYRCRVVPLALEDWLAVAEPRTFDSLVMVNVLEHIKDDHSATHGLYKVLKTGGRLMIFVPALPFLYSELDRKYGHHRRYTRRSLKDCIENAGFRIEMMRYFDIAGVLPWWILNTVLGKTTFHRPSLVFYDKLVVPATKFLESVLPPPIGKNLILIARRD